MATIDVLPMMHSWPLFERDRRFDLGCDFAVSAAVMASNTDELLAARGIGRWECDLSDDNLTWSAGVYDLFGLPRGSAVTRAEAVALYAEGSRAIMEKLRSYAIRHRRGFTMDAQIRPVQGSHRWIRLIATPTLADDRVTHLIGLKRDVTHEYRR